MKLNGMMKLLISFGLIALLSGCSLNRTSVKTDTLGNASDLDWYNSDISALPIADDPEALSGFANELSGRAAPQGQKSYALRLAMLAHEKNKSSKSIALVLARTAFFVADSLDNESEMKKKAEIGIQAAEIAGLKDKDPEACYYYALNLGLIVQAKGLFALDKLPAIADALNISLNRPALDRGGPLRVLGMLYLKAPSWPRGIGDLDKSLELLEKAVKNYPAHPQNFMFYAQALMENDENQKAKEYLEIAKRLAAPELWGMYYSKKWRGEIDNLLEKISD